MSRTAVVTGASRGIGRAVAIALADEGFDVVSVGLSDPDGDETVASAVRLRGRQFLAFALDLAALGEHAAVLDGVLRARGSIDCLVNNAGVSVRQRGDLLDVDVDSFDRCLDVNARGTFFWTQAVARSMAAAAPPAHHRSIVFVTSSNAVAASIERGEYCMSKAALSMAAKLFAIRLAPHAIGVYEVQPGIIATGMTAPARATYDARIAGGLLVEPRWGQPEDVARVVRTMAAGLLPYTVAQAVHPDGGLLLNRF